MTLRYSAALRNARLDQIKTKIDISAPGTVEIRNGVQPATPETAATGTLLATLTMSNPSAPGAAAGVLTFSAITRDSAADATGTPTWFRVKDGAGTAVLDGDAAVGSGTMNFLTGLTIGQPVEISSWTITDGNV